jgi:hypothetical protein
MRHVELAVTSLVTDTIYDVLLGAAPGSIRPVQAVPRAGGLHQIVSKNDDPEAEEWEFPSGSLVRCERRVLPAGSTLVAVEAAQMPGLRVVST